MSMYCSSCGLQLTQELRYCPRCGANLNPPERAGNPPNIVGPVWAVSVAVTLITLAGLGLLFAFAMIITARGLDLHPGVFMMVSLFLLGILAVDGLLIRQLSRLLNLYSLPEAESAKSDRSQELGGKFVPQLEAVRETPSSVTENTTRTFEPIPRERQTR
jgi:hypothetical protein